MTNLQTYRYEIWNGKESLGLYESEKRLAGGFIVFPGGFRIPIGSRVLRDDGVDYLVRIVLDVSEMKKKVVMDFLKSLEKRQNGESYER